MKHVGRCLPALIALALLTTTFAAPAGAQTVSTGQTANGSYYYFAVPAAWNGTLVIYNHGFDLAPVRPVDPDGQVALIEELVGALGFAVAASSYSQNGWALFKTNTDLEQMVREFESQFGNPAEVIVTGASLGGIVTASALEKADLGNVVGAFTFCGAMAGSRNWNGALDARLIYDSICTKKKERIEGGAKGLPKGVFATPEESAKVATSVNACFGLDKENPKKKQLKKRKRFTDATGIPDNFIQTIMSYTTFGMSDLVYDKQKLKGKIGVGNMEVDYGIARVNKKIERVQPKKSREKKLNKFYTPNGNVGDVKIVSMHTDKDGLVIVENQSEYAKVVPAENLTVGVVVEDVPTHCGFSNAELVGGLQALLAWTGGGAQPTAADLQTQCNAWAPIVGGACRIDPDFEIPDMDGRIRPRE